MVSCQRRTMQRAATKYLHAARPAEVTHVYCVPLLPDQAAWSIPSPDERPDPIAAVCFDFRSSQREFLLLEPAIEDLFAAIAQSLGEFWGEMPLYDPDILPDEAGAAEGDWRRLDPAVGFFVSGRKVRARVERAIQIELDDAIKRIGTDLCI